MDIQTITGVPSTHIGLTMVQRWYMKAIVDGRSTRLIESACESFVALGLVRRSGTMFVATDAGRYIAALF